MPDSLKWTVAMQGRLSRDRFLHVGDGQVPNAVRNTILPCLTSRMYAAVTLVVCTGCAPLDTYIIHPGVPQQADERTYTLLCSARRNNEFQERLRPIKGWLDTTDATIGRVCCHSSRSLDTGGYRRISSYSDSTRNLN